MGLETECYPSYPFARLTTAAALVIGERDGSFRPDVQADNDTTPADAG